MTTSNINVCTLYIISHVHTAYYDTPHDWMEEGLVLWPLQLPQTTHLQHNRYKNYGHVSE